MARPFFLIFFNSTSYTIPCQGSINHDITTTMRLSSIFTVAAVTTAAFASPVDVETADFSDASNATSAVRMPASDCHFHCTYEWRGLFGHYRVKSGCSLGKKEMKKACAVTNWKSWDGGVSVLLYFASQVIRCEKWIVPCEQWLTCAHSKKLLSFVRLGLRGGSASSWKSTAALYPVVQSEALKPEN
jgi:hypothetical protein